MTLSTAAKGAVPNTFSIGQPTPGSFDLQSVLAHEFGHVFGLGHANQGSKPNQTGVLKSSVGSGDLTNRNLYPWDIECHERLYGRRSQSIRYRNQPHNATTFDASNTVMASNYVRGLGNARVSGGVVSGPVPYYSSVAYNNYFRNSSGLTLDTGSGFNQQYVGGFSNSWFRELPTRWRTMYNYDYDSANRYENQSSLMNVWQYAYEHSFDPSTITQGRMYYCSLDRAFGCSSQQVYSYHPISTSYDGFSSRTVFAWVNQTRGNDASDREIWISVGTRSGAERTLNKPFKTGIRSSINVSVACGPTASANGYDCIMVYAPLESTTYALTVRRFLC